MLLVQCINGFVCRLRVVVLSIAPCAAGHKEACPIK
jgi:hypothetical protein